MLKIEVIKFEAQDVITSSVAAPECTCDEYCFVDHGACEAEKHNCEFSPYEPPC